jgi:hypothetical protein
MDDLEEKLEINPKTEWYFKPRDWERHEEGLIYQRLGVKFFKKIVPTLGEYVNHIINVHPIRDAESKEEALKEIEGFTRIFEVAHTIGLAVMTPCILMPIIYGDYVDAARVTAVTLSINIYPIMLQRYNRARIYNALGIK